MGKALNSVLLVALFTIAFGLALSREAETESKQLFECHSINDCKLEGCPCVKGICRCSGTSEAAEAYSRKPTQLTNKARLQHSGDGKCEGTKAEAEALLP